MCDEEDWAAAMIDIVQSSPQVWIVTTPRREADLPAIRALHYESLDKLALACGVDTNDMLFWVCQYEFDAEELKLAIIQQFPAVFNETTYHVSTLYSACESDICIYRVLRDRLSYDEIRHIRKTKRWWE